MSKRNRLYIVLGIIFLAIGAIFLFTWESLIRFEVLPLSPFYILTFGVTFIITGLTFILFVYLQGGLSIQQDLSRKELSLQREEMVRLTEMIKESAFKKVDIDQQAVEKDIKERIDEITSDKIWSEIKKEFGKEFIDNRKRITIEEELKDIKLRIQSEIERLSRNANLNLAIGFFTTFLAIFFLGYSLLTVEGTDDYKKFLTTFIPRLSLSVFIEIFSFFFLRLYKSTLDNIKYFNNERTNIDLKLLGLRTSLLDSDTDTVKDVISELVRSERNFILKKGESTVEIEKARLDTEEITGLIDNLSKIAGKK